MKTDRKLFWSIILLGLVCVGIGAGVMWFDRESGPLSEDRGGWVNSEARVYEVGIRRATGETGVRYEMTVRYVLTVGGRDYEGSGIAGGYSTKSPAAVKSLIVPFAAEAAEYSLQDLGTLNPQRTWSVAYLTVPARYDPRDPAHSHIVLANPLMNDRVGAWILSGVAWILVLAGVALCVFAWPVARRLKTNPPGST
jgi:hypothetical protein